MQQTEMSRWSEDLVVPRLLYRSFIYEKKEIFEELKGLCSGISPIEWWWINTIEINISNVFGFAIGATSRFGYVRNRKAVRGLFCGMSAVPCNRKDLEAGSQL